MQRMAKSKVGGGKHGQLLRDPSRRMVSGLVGEMSYILSHSILGHKINYSYSASGKIPVQQADRY